MSCAAFSHYYPLGKDFPTHEGICSRIYPRSYRPRDGPQGYLLLRREHGRKQPGTALNPEDRW